MNEAEVKYHGFLVSKDMALFINENMQKLKDMCPADSFMAIALSAVNSHYHGELTINSHDMSFRAENKDESLVSVIINVLTEVETQLTRWKRLRFSLDPYRDKAQSS